jgi:hypothetical protein
MTDIDTTHIDYSRERPDWQKIEHITRLRMLPSYLIRLNPHDASDENEQRNRHYRERAIFYAFAAQTVQGLLGTMFRKDPKLSVPDTLSYVRHNADGAGNSLYQQSQGLCDDVIRKSRAGLYVSFPPTPERGVSQQDMIEGRFVATIHRLEPEQVINWRTTTIGARTKLSLVVIRETKEKTDRYAVDTFETIRELYLDENGFYAERFWSNENGSWEVLSTAQPTDAQGNRWGEIPFIFVGAENNDTSVDRPVMLPLVEVNIGHYRNSADWEDSVWYSGQPQPYMVGMTSDHVEMMAQEGMYVGSRNILGVPDGGSFGFAAPPPNPLVRQAMQDKVEMMLALGARLLQPGSAAKTATEVAGIREAQHSVLSLIAANVSEAYTQALQWAATYMGVAPGPEMDEIYYAINQDYAVADASPQELQAMMAGFVQGSIPISDYVRYMQRIGHFDGEKSDEDYGDILSQSGMTMNFETEPQAE